MQEASHIESARKIGAARPGLLRRLRRALGPLGRYRPDFLRKNMAAGFKSCDLRVLPDWARCLKSPEERLLDQLDLSGRVVYDIGAHTGDYSLYFSRRVGPEGWVISFEPQPYSYAKLERNLRLNRIRNVRPFPLALGRRRERKPIYMLPGMPTTASLAVEARTRLRRQCGEAQVTPLDQLMNRHPLPVPDLIKIDVEGLEWEVLEGAGHCLSRHHPSLLIEIHGADREHKSERTRQMAGYLTGLGYSLLHAESGVDFEHCAPRIASGHLFAQYVTLKAEQRLIS